MSTFFKRLRRQKESPFHMEQEIQKCLTGLQNCTATVVVMGPEYDNPHYRCKILADTTDLIAWAEHHAKTVWSVDVKNQAARQALPLWLCRADLTNQAAAYITPEITNIVEPYLLDLINLGIAVVVCPDCQHVVKDIEKKRSNERKAAEWSWWTAKWYCPEGHLLYQEDHELHIVP